MWKIKPLQIMLRKQVQTAQQLRDIKELDQYLNYLGSDKVKHHVLILISAKDTIGLAVTKALSAKFCKCLGCQTDLHDQHWKGYLAIIHRGEVLKERLSNKEESVESILQIEDLNVAVFSSSYRRENVSQILLDGKDYSINSRGLNIVVYDWRTRRVCDAVNFDTHVPGYPCTRERNEEHSLDIRHSAAYLERRIDELSEGIRSLEDRVMCNAKKEQMVLWQIYERAYGNTMDAKRAFFVALPKATGWMRKFQKVGIILLENFDRICRQNGIIYWLGFGTLLGAVRHKGFIPWDDDTDVCMTRDQFEKMSLAMEQETEFYIDEYVFTDIGSTNLCRQFRVRELPLSLDIYVYDYCPDVSKENIQRQFSLKKEMSQKGWDIYCKMQKDNKQRTIQLTNLVKEYQKRAQQEIGIQIQPDAGALMWAIDNVGALHVQGSCLPLEKIFPLITVEFEGHLYPSPVNPEEYLARMYGDIYILPDDMISHKHFSQSFIENELDQVLDRFKK